MKVEVALAYLGALVTGGPIAQALAPNAPPDIFLPAFSGAATAALFTVKPAFDSKDETPPRAIAFLGAVTLFVGFVFSYTCSQPLNTMATPQLGPIGPIGPMNLDPSIAAMLCGFAGEKLLWGVWQVGPKGWLEMARKALPGGGK